MENRNEWRSDIQNETLDLFQKLQEEYQIPPMFSCLHLGGFCLANIIAAYQRHNKEVPKELLEFMEKVYPKLLEDQAAIIEEQYLTLNTEGTA